MFETTKKIIYFCFRPGFTKEYSNPFEVTMQGASLVKKTYQNKRNSIESERIVLNEIEEKFTKEKYSPKHRFNAWVEAFQLTDDDLNQLLHQQNAMGILNYCVLCFGLVIMAHIIKPSSPTFISEFTSQNKILFVGTDIIFCINSFLRAIKYMHYKHEIKNKALTPISTTLFNIKRWF